MVVGGVIYLLGYTDRMKIKRISLFKCILQVHFLAIIFSVILIGCVTVPEVNDAFRRIERLWLLEYQKTEDDYRHRVIEAPYETVYEQTKKTFLDLGFPVTSQDFEKGIIIGKANAPTPLSLEEWKKIAEFEGPRVKEHGGWFMKIKDNPDQYIITGKAALKRVGSKTFVLLDYELTMPEYERNGMLPTKVAPPMAVQLGSIKFWLRIEERLEELGIKAPRKRTRTERAV